MTDLINAGISPINATEANRLESALRTGLAELRALEKDWCRVRKGDDHGAAVAELVNLAAAIADKRIALRLAIVAARETLGMIAALDAANRPAWEAGVAEPYALAA